jgi:alternate signal-mediated exported protein
MKKVTKASIAAGAAVVLLLSSAGTLAYWNDTVNVGSPAAISAGDLRLTQAAAPAWSITHTDGTSTAVADLAAVRIVPGDKLTYHGAYTVSAQGQNLSFKAEVAAGSIAPATPGNAADEALKTRLLQSANYVINGVKGQSATIEHKKNTAGTYDVTIDVTLDWPFDAPAGTSSASDNAAKLGVVNLSQFAVSVTQVDGTP